MKPHKYLSADGLFRLVHQKFGEIEDHRPKNVIIPLEDALMSAFAMFSLKSPSLLSFDQQRSTSTNIEKVYNLKKVPSDTQMRTILDNVEPADIRPLFKVTTQPKVD